MSFNKLSCRCRMKGKNHEKNYHIRKTLDNRKDSKRMGRVENNDWRAKKMRGDKLGVVRWDLGNENQNIS